jgi:hypothetical protein
MAFVDRVQLASRSGKLSRRMDRAQVWVTGGVVGFITWVAMDVATLAQFPVRLDAQAAQVPDDLRNYERVKRDSAVLPEAFRFDQSFQNSNQCGPNCLYAAARLMRLQADMAQILKEVSVTAEGSSLGDLERAANQLGMPFQSRGELNLRALRTAAKPIVFHASAVEEREGEPKANDHFLLLVDNFEDTWLVIDGTQCSLLVIPEKHLARLGTGYGLVLSEDAIGPPTGRSTIWPRLLLVTTVALALVNVGLFVKSRRVRGR